MSHHIEGLEGRRLFAAGSLDVTFGLAGTTGIRLQKSAYTTDPDVGPYAWPAKFVSDAAGRIISVISGDNVSSTLTRLKADGTLDTTFAAGETNNQLIFKGRAQQVAVDANNRVYVLQGDALTRLTSRGKIDRTFGRNGSINLAANTNPEARDVKLASAKDMVIDGRGRIWVLASVYSDSSGRFYAMKVFRFNADGQYDKRFSGDGVYNVPLPGPGRAENRSAFAGDMVLLRDGSVMIAGEASMRSPDNPKLASRGVEVVKFTPGGALDAGYGQGGIVVYRLTETARPNGAGNGLAAWFDTLTDDGQVIVETTDKHAKYQHIDEAGRFAGKVNPFDAAGLPIYFGTVARAADGSRYFLNSTRNNIALGTENRLYHVLADGTLDPNFNNGQPIDDVTAAAVLNDGTIVYGTPTLNEDPVSVKRIFADEGPVAQYAGGLLTTAGKDYLFNLLWRDDDGIDVGTLDNTDVYLRGNGGVARGRVVARKVLADGQVVVSYAARGPGDRWAATSNGQYAVSIARDAVKDTGGQAATARTIGTLTVAIE